MVVGLIAAGIAGGVVAGSAAWLVGCALWAVLALAMTGGSLVAALVVPHPVPRAATVPPLRRPPSRD